MEEIDRKELQDVKTQVALLQVEFKTFSGDIAEVKKILENFRNPRPTNWVGICSFGLALTLGVASFVGMYLTLRLTPIEKDLLSLSNDFKTQSARVLRDMEWNYQTQADRHSFTDRTIDRMWDRIFAGDPPKFQEKPRP